MSEAQPGAAEIAAWLDAVADGRADRDAADRWAGRWLLDDALEWDEVSRRGLELLYGIDLRSGAGEPYLHDAEQVRGWAAELRARAG
ncbi:hypothetical protein [Kitasatospora cheerisanensis]|uniref:Uncharacterized protein n=1 Tax=Kitasatospora cheerisanensis KCTC 2395 TaxID=1348663 RepID=A0A066YTI5_9ACTN|nr:hypothetical protein [Kitasatospora cheerisanensis]KDN81210.1 hypothetical protein KCH_70210 [Kitasatospora cheerisanensis KCTC 2395]